ncbi:hypothetical protein FIU86_06290 [Roseovarius sp. THAF9]|nr:hypothetical protein FIU86_06290 [Roseovarius sp. THAF9]
MTTGSADMAQLRTRAVILAVMLLLILPLGAAAGWLYWLASEGRP